MLGDSLNIDKHSLKIRTVAEMPQFLQLPLQKWMKNQNIPYDYHYPQ